MRAIESQYLGDVSSLPCSVCGKYGVELHHPRIGQGMAQRAEHFLVIPVCPDCHRGHAGIHGDRSLLKARRLTEMDLLAKTIELIYSRHREIEDAF
jgi:hypothetical protein